MTHFMAKMPRLQSSPMTSVVNHRAVQSTSHHAPYLSAAFALSTGSTCSHGFSLVSVNEMYFSWLVSECHRPDVTSLAYSCQRLFAKLLSYWVHLSASLKLAFRPTLVYWSPLLKSRSQCPSVHLKAIRSLLSTLLLRWKSVNRAHIRSSSTAWTSISV